ncbi:MAG: hypothetical protein KIS62_00770 [Ramlibacter sp.]|nr:hypothetical protein [Ramlibacter sp.]
MLFAKARCGQDIDEALCAEKAASDKTPPSMQDNSAERIQSNSNDMSKKNRIHWRDRGDLT